MISNKAIPTKIKLKTDCFLTIHERYHSLVSHRKNGTRLGKQRTAIWVDTQLGESAAYILNPRLL